MSLPRLPAGADQADEVVAGVQRGGDEGDGGEDLPHHPQGPLLAAAPRGQPPGGVPKQEGARDLAGHRALPPHAARPEAERLL